MCAHDYPPEPRPIPRDQIGIPKMATEYGPRRLAWSTSVAKSYRRNTIRVRPPMSLAAEPVDIVPNPRHASATPSRVLGDEVVVGFFVSGVNAFGAFADAGNNKASRDRLAAALAAHTWQWWPAVALPPKRTWIESGAVIANAFEDEVLQFAKALGQDVVLRWDAEGLTPLATRPGLAARIKEHPVPVTVRPALTGCPMRQGIDEWCRNPGGYFTSSALLAARTWETHRQLLVDALGCSVCGGGPIGLAKYSNMTNWFQPTRVGGWVDSVPFAKPTGLGLNRAVPG